MRAWGSGRSFEKRRRRRQCRVVASRDADDRRLHLLSARNLAHDVGDARGHRAVLLQELDEEPLHLAVVHLALRGRANAESTIAQVRGGER
jgi:hypothetical protein